MPFHPLTVHLPIGLAVALLIVLAVMQVKETGKEARQGALLLFGIYVGSLILATLTGRSAETDITYTEAIGELLDIHEILAYVAIWANGLLLVWMYLRVFRWKKGEFVAFLLAFLFVSGSLFYSAHLGGKMVYEEGAGVSLPVEIESP